MIIGLSGRAGCGKSTAASYLELHGYMRVRFAGPLKAMLREYLRVLGVSKDQMERMIEGDLKGVPCDELDGATPRHAMQTLGTEWGRDAVSSSFWTHAWDVQRGRLNAAGCPDIVAEDVRFPNEAATIRKDGGFIIRINRGGLPDAAAAGHSSEEQEVFPDAIVWNDGPKEILYYRLDGLIERFTRVGRSGQSQAATPYQETGI